MTVRNLSLKKKGYDMDRREMLERFLTWMREGKSQTWPEEGPPMFERLDDGTIVGLTRGDEGSAETMKCLLARVPLEKLHLDPGVKVECDERDMADPWRAEHDVVTKRVWWNGVYGGDTARAGRLVAGQLLQRRPSALLRQLRERRRPGAVRQVGLGDGQLAQEGGRGGGAAVKKMLTPGDLTRAGRLDEEEVRRLSGETGQDRYGRAGLGPGGVVPRMGVQGRLRNGACTWSWWRFTKILRQ